MKGLEFMHSPGLYIEIGQNSLKALDGEDGLELSLDRLENGRLTPLCLKRLALSLRVFLKKHNWRSHLTAFCAVGARGVSLRQLSLPSGRREDIERLLPLQIEREFPLAPDDLAWGWLALAEHLVGNGAPAGRQLLVAAMKREAIDEYAELLSGCGLTPVFTLAALARSSLCSQPPGKYAVLEVGPDDSELISYENGMPISIRVLPWGEKSLAQGGEPANIQSPLIAGAHGLAQVIQPGWIGQRLYLSGQNTPWKELAPLLAKALGGGVECARLDTAPGEGRSAAVLGLKKTCEIDKTPLPLVLQLTGAEAERTTQAAPWKWAALAALLAIFSLSLRYAEPLLFKPRLSKQIADIRAYRERLPNIDRELTFLQFLKTNQPPYLNTLFAMAGAAPAGTRLESLSMNGRGELSLRGAMRDSQQVADFRSKLIDSGHFSTVVVEEQTPTPDRQKLTVRITGQWRRGGETGRAPARSAGRTNAVGGMTNEQIPIPKE